MDPTVELGIDGFPLEPGDPDIRYHRELNTWLELNPSQGLPVALKFDPPAEWPRWLRPALRRFVWVRAHSDLIAPDRKLDARIAHLISYVLNRMFKPEAGEETFAELASQAAAIEANGAGSMFRADTGRLLLDLMKAGIGPETRQSIHSMLRALPPEGRSAGMHELAWKLFLDFEDPDDGEPCWSAQVRNDLRELKPAQRKAWISLLKLAPIRLGPDVKWGQKAAAALEKIGSQEYQSRTTAWLSGLRGAGPVALERPGQILLRLLIEMSHVAESPELLRSLGALANAPWDSSRSKAFWNEIEPRLAAAPPPKPVKIADISQVLELARGGTWAGFEQVAEYTKKHGYHPEIVAAIRQYHDTLHGSVSDQARRQHVGWWLWLEDVTPIQPEDCWSSIVRADLRAFTGKRKQAWMDLIGNMTFAIGSKIPAKWTKAAETALAAIGPEDFRTQMRRWLAPMKEATVHRLTTPGRDALRCLVWTCGLCPPDTALDEALSWIGAAQWKNKESRDRMLKISGPLAQILAARDPQRAWEALDGLAAGKIIAPPMPEYAQYLELSQRFEKTSREVQAKPQPKAPDLQSVLQKAMVQMLQRMPGSERINPDHILVRGERDHYRIGMDGIITRRSGRQARVNMEALPPYITQLVQPSIDALDLQQGMFQPNQMRLFSLATILANDAQWESAID